MLRRCAVATTVALARGARPGARARTASSSRGGRGPVGALLFDIDGTLFDSDPLHYAAFKEMLSAHGREMDEAMFKAQITGRQNADITADLFPEWSTEQGRVFSEAKEARFRELARERGLATVAGLEKILEWVERRGLPRAAVTNAPRANAEFMLDVIGVRDFFDAVVVGDECLRAKPDPLPYLEAMDALGVRADDCAAFEDSFAGAKAAAASGAYTFGILSSQAPDVLLRAGCAQVIPDYTSDQLWAFLE